MLPETGASTKRSPTAVIALFKTCGVWTPLVLISTMIADFLHASSNPGASITSSTVVPDVKNVMIMSADATDALRSLEVEKDGVVISFFSASSFSTVRFHIVTGTPSLASSLAIAEPILPAPTISTFVIRFQSIFFHGMCH